MQNICEFQPQTLKRMTGLGLDDGADDLDEVDFS